MNINFTVKTHVINSAVSLNFSSITDMMSDGVSRLRMLAKGLGDEIESQNEQLDRINAGVERADIKITDQNRQMRGILK